MHTDSKNAIWSHIGSSNCLFHNEEKIILQQKSIQFHTIPISSNNQHRHTNTIFVLDHATYDRISSVFHITVDYGYSWE